MGILVGVEEDSCSIITFISNVRIGNYSRAQRYGLRERMFGRAHVSRLNALLLDSELHPFNICADIISRSEQATSRAARISSHQSSDSD